MPILPRLRGRRRHRLGRWPERGAVRRLPDAARGRRRPGQPFRLRGAPTWSPGGRFLVAGQAEGAPNELVVIDRQGEAQATIESAASESVSWKDLGS